MPQPTTRVGALLLAGAVALCGCSGATTSTAEAPTSPIDPKARASMNPKLKEEMGSMDKGKSAK